MAYKKTFKLCNHWHLIKIIQGPDQSCDSRVMINPSNKRYIKHLRPYLCLLAKRWGVSPKITIKGFKVKFSVKVEG